MAKRRSGRTPIHTSTPDLTGALKSRVSEDCGLSGMKGNSVELNEAY
jgi:hypothetical protein